MTRRAAGRDLSPVASGRVARPASRLTGSNMNPIAETIALIEQLENAFNELVGRCEYWRQPVGSNLPAEFTTPVYRFQADTTAARDIRQARARFFRFANSQERFPALYEQIVRLASPTLPLSEIRRTLADAAALLQSLPTMARAISTASCPRLYRDYTHELHRDPAEEAEPTYAEFARVLRGLHELQVVVRPPEPSVTPKRASPNDPRDKAMYQWRMKGKSNAWIIAEVKKRAKKWDYIDNAPGIRRAILRYCDRHNLPAPG
jgi:hypothetical protein